MVEASRVTCGVIGLLLGVGVRKDDDQVIHGPYRIGKSLTAKEDHDLVISPVS
jgi:hypothetical protein